MSLVGGSILLLIYAVITVVGIYWFVLLVKLARRGIKALDIYIENNGQFYKQDINK